MNKKTDKVVILGASNNHHRFSYKAFRLLREKGYSIVPVHPAIDAIEGVSVRHSFAEIKEKIHTVTVYVSPANLLKLINALINLKPERVILNPGTESEEVIKALQSAGIRVVRECTLILLNSERFDDA